MVLRWVSLWALHWQIYSFHDERLLCGTPRPLLHRWHVDDTFRLYNDEAEADQFLSSPNSLHPFMRFTCTATLYSNIVSDLTL